MKSPRPSRLLPRLIAPLLLVALPPLAGAGDFLEKFALSSDRDAVLKELIPGTEEYYYYHALHFQNTGKAAEMEAILKEWEGRSPAVNPRRDEIRNRQALKDYATEPAKALETLRNALHVNYHHQRIAPEARPELATKLDPATISWEAFLTQALNGTEAFANVNDSGFTAILRAGTVPLTPPRRRDLLSRLQHPDVPKLVEIINDDLATKESQGFGEFKIHEFLTLAQMEDLLKLRPKLLQDSKFALAWAGKLRPPFGQDADRDPAVREAWLDRLESFTARLGPAFNSLKAYVLYHRLAHDRGRGVVNETRLLSYLQLPRTGDYLNPDWKNQPAFEDTADLSEDFSDVIDFPAVQDDEPLVRELLLTVLGQAGNADKFAHYLRDQWLNALLAEAKLTSGSPDAARWISLLSPDAYQALKDRVDLEFDPASREEWAPEDEVSLDVGMKNVPRVIVRIFEINTENVHRSTGKEVDTDLDLDGLTANAERTYDYTEAPLLRTKRSFTLPELKGKRGVWIVEFIGGGKSSRALIRKGGLRFLSHPSAGGLRLTVLDERTRPVSKAWAQLGTRRFDGDEKGDILIPFSTEPGEKTVVLGDGTGLTSLETIEVPGEEYNLHAAFHVPEESLLPGAAARLLTRTSLLAGQTPIPLAALENTRLTVISTNHEGVTASMVYPLKILETNADAVVDFNVPDRLRTLQFILEADVTGRVTGQPVHLWTEKTINVNGQAVTDAVDDLHLSQEDGQWVLYDLGRNGEPRADREVNAVFSRPEFKQTLPAVLKTDASGAIQLGKLEGIGSFVARHASGRERHFTLPRAQATLPVLIQVGEGEPVQFAWTGSSPPGPGDISVLEMRGEAPVRDLSASASAKGGFVTISGLTAGEYVVQLASNDRPTTVRVVTGTRVSGHVVSASGTLELSNPAPLAITAMARGEASFRDRNEKRPVLVFHIGNVSVDTRVHLFASRYLPAKGLEELYEDHLPDPSAEWPEWRPSFYQNARGISGEYRYVLERRGQKHFAGNMLARPGLLLTPWAVAETSTDIQTAAEGEERSAMDGPGKSEVTGGGTPDTFGLSPETGPVVEPDYSFLPAPGTVMLNLRPDKEGNVIVDAALLGDRQFIRLVAIDSDSAASRDFSLPATELRPRDLRLTDALEPGKHYSRQNRVTVLEKDAPVEFKDSRTVLFRPIADLGSAFALLRNLSGNATLAEFSWLMEWPTLTAERKAELYSKYACHELHFFLARKDPDFFKRVVQPYLASKRDKTFMDHYLTGADMTGYLRPWQYSRLNAVERILLARRLEAEQPVVRRMFKDWLETVPKDSRREAFLFEAALRGNALAGGGRIIDPGDSGVQTVGRVVVDPAQFDGPAGSNSNTEGFNLFTNKLGMWTDLNDTSDFQSNVGGAFDWRHGRRPANFNGIPVPESSAPFSVAGTDFIPDANRWHLQCRTGKLRVNDADGDGYTAEYYFDAPTGGDVIVDLQLSPAQAEYDGFINYGTPLNGTTPQTPAINGRYRRGVDARDKAEFGKEGAGFRPKFFRQMEKTKEWVENNYYRLTAAQQTADLIIPNRFWQDFALWDGARPFVSPHLPEAAGSFTEMVLALATLDIPFPNDAKAPKLEPKDNRLVLTPAGRGLLFHQEIRPAEMEKDGAPLLVSRNFFRQGDRYTEEAGERTDKFITGEFLAGVAYGAQIVVTNPSASRQRLDLLFQIPRGAIPLLTTRPTQSLPVELEPYHTGTWDFQFYFPAPGQYPQYPVHLSRNGKTAAFTPEATLEVVAKPTQGDNASWEYVSQNAAPAEVLAYLGQHNLQALNLDLMAWRLKDGEFFRGALSLLRARHHFHPLTWSYALLHNVPEGVSDYLQYQETFLDSCGAWLDTAAVKIDPVERRRYEHLEYSPVINARAHVLGGTRAIMNDKLRAQYQSLLHTLLYRPSLDAEQNLAVCYYLAVQDRLEEALDFFAKVDPAKVTEQLQYDYLHAWLALCQEDTATARRIAQARAGYPVERWSVLFADLNSQLDEIDGKAPAIPRPEDRETTQDALASKDPVCNLRVEDRVVKLDYRNLTEVTVNYYPMDLEFLFSANPFVTQDTSRFRMIRPDKSARIMLPAGATSHALPLPAEYRDANVLVEVTGGGLTKAAASYANELNVQVSENTGSLQVLHRGDKHPLPKVYVKVFADRNGKAEFYKDGYTDLRGKFDYVSLSTGDLDTTKRFSVLIMSPDHGATVKEIQPPKR